MSAATKGRRRIWAVAIAFGTQLKYSWSRRRRSNCSTKLWTSKIPLTHVHRGLPYTRLRETQQLSERKKMLRDRLKQRSTIHENQFAAATVAFRIWKEADTYTAWGWQDAVAYDEKTIELESKRRKEKNNNVSLKIQQYIEEGRSLLSRQKKSKLKGGIEKDGMEKESAKVTNITMTPGRNPLMEPVDPSITMEKSLHRQRFHLRSG